MKYSNYGILKFKDCMVFQILMPFNKKSLNYLMRILRSIDYNHGSLGQKDCMACQIFMPFNKKLDHFAIQFLYNCLLFWSTWQFK